MRRADASVRMPLWFACAMALAVVVAACAEFPEHFRDSTQENRDEDGGFASGQRGAEAALSDAEAYDADTLCPDEWAADPD